METFGCEFTNQGWEPPPPGADWEDAPNLIQMAMMTGHGDLRKIWNAANPDEVEDARRSWNHLVKEKKYRAYRVNPSDNSKAEQMTEFDASAGKMILVPPVRGG